MSSIEFHIFRAKFVKSKQGLLFSSEKTSSEIFQLTIDEKPSLVLNEGHYWHIGNVDKFEDSTGYFAVGRTTKTIIEKYDEGTKNFIEEEYEQSPYTHVLYDSKMGLLAIARKTRLAPTVNGIARKIEKLFSQTTVLKDFDIEVAIDYLRDPETFISLLNSAYAIKRFTATFGGPNPFDADEYFQKPLSVYLQEANGKKGKTIIDGEDLNNDTLSCVTSSVAATGNDASAKIQQIKNSKPKTIHLGTNQVTFSVQEEVFSKKAVIEEMQSKYKAVRSK